MQGRYGSDQLNLFLVILAMAVMVASIFVSAVPAISIAMDIASWGLIIWSFARMFSRKTDARRMENYKFCVFIYRIRNWFRESRPSSARERSTGISNVPNAARKSGCRKDWEK